jgi:hypothetical protein
MAAEDVGDNACGQNASYVNTSCALPPDAVNVTWLIQNIVSIQDIAQACLRSRRAAGAALRCCAR